MIYQLTRSVVALYFKLYYRLSVSGKEKLPKERPIIIASNHASYLDPPVVGYAFCPEQLRFVAWEKLFEVPLFGTYLRAMGAVADRDGGMRRHRQRKRASGRGAGNGSAGELAGRRHRKRWRARG